MPISFNGNSPQNITFNGNQVDKVVYNGDVVWEKLPQTYTVTYSDLDRLQTNLYAEVRVKNGNTNIAYKSSGSGTITCLPTYTMTVNCCSWAGWYSRIYVNGVLKKRDNTYEISWSETTNKNISVSAKFSNDRSVDVRITY